VRKSLTTVIDDDSIAACAFSFKFVAWEDIFDANQKMGGIPRRTVLTEIILGVTVLTGKM